ncbi:hypothetical protein CDL15_Pgr016122 [Punica granatum]|uniref:Uncharacterized protein n=1 Tax=Punica granatum TaxID=22663 RepID=A0A218X0Q9_PUNGR|nr:hypothetical protein CDL15_Pgr016122 [Punica granatum]
MKSSSSLLVAAALLVITETASLFPSCTGDGHVRNCSESDRETLLRFKDRLDDPQNQLASWTGSNCCRWIGIGCNKMTGAVASINLGNRRGFWNLSGEISPSLLNLRSSLQRIDLSFNSFDGVPVPGFLGQLVNLQYLNLSNSGFSGPVPPSLGNLSSLVYLDLSSEFLGLLSADNIDWLSGMSSLRFLGLDGVELSVVGPDWAGVLNNLPRLTDLHLRGCGLAGLAPSFSSVNFTSLAVLDLSVNPLSSEIPAWTANITSLEYLDMSSSGLFGRIPLGFRELPNLRSLILSGNNNLSASCSQLLRGSWGKIEVLDLSSNGIHGRIPSSIGNMTSLIDFSVFANNVEGGIPSTIGSLCSLVSFDLSGNNLTGILPGSLLGTEDCISNSSLPSLMQLRLSNNQLNGLLPDWLGQLKSLVELSLDYNSLQGPIPASLGKLRNLTSLGLAGNELNGTLPKSLGDLSELSNFDVSFNHLTGMVSSEHFMKLSKLKILHLSSNSFILNVSSGWIPPFQAGYLDLGSCQIGPRFPDWLRSQNEVEYLDFSNASISGPIPKWFWDISSNLSLLNISLNQLQGQLPNPLKASPFADIDL